MAWKAKGPVSVSLLLLVLSCWAVAAPGGGGARAVQKPVVHRMPLRQMTTAADVLQVKRDIYQTEDYEMRRISVQQMTLKDLNGDGKDDVVAFLNLDCTADPAEVVTVMSSGEQYLVQRFSAEHACSDRSLKDIDGDGVSELIVWCMIVPSHAPHADAVEWPEIYRWGDDGFGPASEEFSVYYQTDYLGYLAGRLQEVARLSALNRGPETDEKLAAINLAVLRDCVTGLERTVALLESVQKAPAEIRGIVGPAEKGPEAE